MQKFRMCLHAKQRIDERLSPLGLNFDKQVDRVKLAVERVIRERGLSPDASYAVYLFDVATDQKDTELWATVRGGSVTTVFFRKPRTEYYPYQFECDYIVEVTQQLRDRKADIEYGYPPIDMSKHKKRAKPRHLVEAYA